MYAGIEQKLSQKKAVVRLNLLRLVRNILEARETDYFTNLKDKQLRHLLDSIKILAEKDSAVLVRNLASDLVVSHIDPNSDQLAPPLSASTASTGSNRVRSGRRIYTPPSLHSASSTPLTPTHASRQSQSGAFIEVASSPKRSGVSLAQERDPVAYRPRSKDGISGIPISSPRRLSDIQAGGGSSGGKSRLPRNSGLYAPRPSLSALAIGSRSEGVISNKENIGSTTDEFARSARRTSPPESNGMRTGSVSSSSSSVSGSGRTKRSRAPSEGKQKQSA